MMMSMDYDIPKLLQSELNEIRSLHFYQLINPKHQDLMALGKRLNICPDPAEECRLVPMQSQQFNNLLNLSMLGWIFSLHCFMTAYWLLLME
jgi:hypothetical protein